MTSIFPRVLTALVSISAVAAFTSSASAANSPQMPATAKLIYQAYGATMFGAQSDEAATNTTVSTAKADIKKKEEELNLNVEYMCQEIYYKWAPMNSSSRAVSTGSFMESKTYYSANVTVDVYCVPREYAQKVAISAEQACEKDPKPECMSKVYMDLFAKIRPTTYKNIWH